MSEISDTRPLAPTPAQLAIRVGGKAQVVTYEQAFGLAFSLSERKQFEPAARLFEKLEKFTDRGPRAFIMHAYCEAAALQFDRCSRPLSAAFDGERQSLASDLHNAFISYHVGIRQDAINALVDLVNRDRELPTVCLLLGDMFHALGNPKMARKCWSLAIERDWPNGAVAIVATRHLQATESAKQAS
jgi:hypothetical protein